MNRKKRINDILKKNLKDFQVFIEDNSYLHIGHNNFDGKEETHFLITLQFKGQKVLDKMSIHRKINNLLEKEFNSGLHSLEIKIKN